MTDTAQDRADRILEAALAEGGGHDPRDLCRGQLKALRSANPEHYQQAVDHYRDSLVPAVAAGSAEPLAAWREYAVLLARLTEPGRAVAVDAQGMAHAWEAPGDLTDLVLHLPDDERLTPTLVALPAEPSPAQRATCDWLVGGRKQLREAEA
ncbi:MAG: hypothetical protein RQ751_01135 [Longimicrobiales bacterium]|nr:hypothetical protein [Longimicrobiales bacterium]